MRTCVPNVWQNIDSACWIDLPVAFPAVVRFGAGVHRSKVKLIIDVVLQVDANGTNVLDTRERRLDNNLRQEPIVHHDMDHDIPAVAASIVYLASLF